MDDKFDDMSNDQLRLKLLEYGLANMPVTSTTRKVLIKKLRNQISNGAGKARRETIHITKYSSDEDEREPVAASTGSKKGSAKKDTTNRRATIAGAALKLPKPVSLSQPTPKTAPLVAPPAEPSSASKRRSGRVTPVMKVKDLPATQPGPEVPLILEDSDDDMIPLTQLTQRKRKSKSPSLTRAEMLTTSYMHEMGIAKEPIAEEMDVDVPEVGKNVEEMDVIVLEDEDESSFQSTAMPPPQQPKAPVAKDYQYHQTATQTETRRTYSTTATDTAAGRRAKEELFVEPLSVKYPTNERALPKPTFATPTSYRASTSSVVRDETGSRYEPTDSPYLSEFTKRLSRLRAEAQQPASIGLSRDSPSRRTTIDGNSGSARTQPYASRDPYESSAMRHRLGRQTLDPSAVGVRTVASKQTGGGVRSFLRQNLMALDRKYSIQKIFYAIITVLVVVFLFVFFFL
ncbi:otefin-like [Anopheles nili]|uniref:otefin-like n=1 Tax=Anopheles nili TaxID=185578 RepID=UPI00237ABBF6|nr:otefin-like [Anopheles nili]